MQPGEETYVNDYSPAVSLAWKANTDVQFIMSDLHDVVSYVTGYATKSEGGKTGSEIQQSLEAAKDSPAAFKACIDLLRMRPTGALEMTDLIMGHSCYRFDAGHVFINTNSSDKRFRYLRPRDTVDDEDDRAYKTNVYDQYYPNRHKDLENASLFSVCIQFTTDKSTNATEEIGGDRTAMTGFHKYGNPFRFDYNVKCPKSPFYCYPRMSSKKEFPVQGERSKKHRKLKKPLAPRVYWPNLEASNEESREDYFRRLCMMFIPWR